MTGTAIASAALRGRTQRRPDRMANSGLHERPTIRGEPEPGFDAR